MALEKMVKISWIAEYDRRTFIVSVATIAGFAFLIYKMFNLQIVKSKYYKSRAKKNRSLYYFITPARGNIFDRHKSIIAGSKKLSKIYFSPSEAPSNNSVIKNIAKLVGLNSTQLDKILTAIKINPNRIILIKNNVSGEVKRILLSQSLSLPGLLVVDDFERDYPFNDVFTHIVGYTGRPSKVDVKRGYSQVLANSNVKKGKFGLELSYDRKLRGKLGSIRLNTNALGIADIASTHETKPIKGDDLFTTLDSKVQQKASQLLAKYPQGSAVVMDLQTGHIIAMVSHPSFDPQVFNSRMTQETADKLFKNPHSMLINKTISAHYPPGSVIKPLVALYTMQNKTFDKDHTVNCEGKAHFGDRFYYCWKKGGHGNLNLADSIIQSCDTFFYEIGAKIDIVDFAKFCSKFGLGQFLQTDLLQEIDGVIPSPKYKFDKFREEWRVGDSLISMIGQGYFLTTPLQLTVMMARILTNKMITPTIVQHKNKSEFKTLNLNVEHIKQVQKAMLGVVNNYMGTAFMSSHIWKGSKEKMGGKTGTSQVKGFSNSEREDLVHLETTDFFSRPHALFTGFAPHKSPRFVATVVLDHNGAGSIAGNVASQLLKFVVDQYNNKSLL